MLGEKNIILKFSDFIKEKISFKNIFLKFFYLVCLSSLLGFITNFYPLFWWQKKQ